jgi:hypothetical protein
VITEVLYVENVQRNLISISKLTAKGARAIFVNQSCTISLNDEVILRGKMVNGLYILENAKAECNSTTRAIEAKSMQQWHECLGHLSRDEIRKLEKMNNIRITNPNEELKCVECALGKQPREKFDRSEKGVRAKRIGEIVHSDVQGPFPVTSLGGANYEVHFIDDFTRYSFVYPIVQKSDVYAKYLEFEAMFETQFNAKISKLRLIPAVNT